MTTTEQTMTEQKPLDCGKVAIIGAGRMGSTLISAWTRSGALPPDHLIATARRKPRLDRLVEEFGVHATVDNRTAAKNANVVLLAVKPQITPRVLDELRDVLTPDHLVLSIVAGMTTAQIEAHLAPEVPVVRAMPNTPALIGRAMTAVCGGRWARKEQVDLAAELFSGVGRCLVLDEKHFDAVTGLSGSGPAFIYIVIEALAEGGVKVGLPRQVATELAAQTCLGAAHMVLETGDHPAQLKDAVTTPAGCTIDGILKLEEGGLRVTLIKSIVEARRRAAELVDDSSS